MGQVTYFKTRKSIGLFENGKENKLEILKIPRDILNRMAISQMILVASTVVLGYKMNQIHFQLF